MKNTAMIQLRGSRTQKEVAQEMGIPLSTYAMIEGGHRFPRPDLTFKMAKYFKCTVDALFFAQEVHESQTV